MNNQEPLISLKEVSVSYSIKKGIFTWDKFTPIKNVSFEIYHGETIGVIGRNGVGKSTILKVIAGIIDADSGQVINNNAKVLLLALGAGFVPQLSGRENVILGGLLLGLEKDFIKNKMTEIEDFADIGQFFDQPLGTYSTGMRARLGFALSIQVNPDVLLIDELLGVGDEDFKKKSTEAMKSRICSEKAVVLVSHSIPTLRELCDRILWIENGITRMIGTPDEVLKKYTET